MATIINNHEFTFSVEQQQQLNNAAANIGVDTIVAGRTRESDSNERITEFYDEYDNYLFSFDHDGVVFE